MKDWLLEGAERLPDGTRLVVRDVTTSTNDDARHLIRTGHRPPFVVVASTQTQGRGRHGRHFHSPPESGLYLTYATEAKALPANLITPLAAVAAADAIAEQLGLQVGIKWVNDLIYRGRKVAGILTEATGGVYLIGIGINIRTRKFPAQLETIAGSLLPETSQDHRAALLRLLVGNLRCRLAEDPAAWLPAYQRRQTLLGSRVRIQGGGHDGLTGVVQGVADDGGLLVAQPGEKEQPTVIYTGEVIPLEDESNTNS